MGLPKFLSLAAVAALSHGLMQCLAQTRSQYIVVRAVSLLLLDMDLFNELHNGLGRSPGSAPS